MDRAAKLARHNGMWWWDRRLRIADWCFALFSLPFSGLAMLAGVGGGLGALSALFGVYGALMDSLPGMWWVLLSTFLVFGLPTILASVAMLWRRSAPKWLLLTGLLLLVLYGNPFPLMVGLYSYPAYFSDRKILTGWFALGCLAVASVFNTAVLAFVMTAMTILVLPTIAGLWIGTRRELIERLRERAERLEREQHLRAERAITAERTRIAREMHDVVAHRVSLMVLHAGGLEVSSVDERTERAAGLIRTTGREALAELRGILGVLREEEGEAAPTAPQPVLADLEGLVAQWRGAGMEVVCERSGEGGVLPLAVQRTGFRVVQEALTNAAKHATGARVRVGLCFGVDRLEVEVANGPVPGVVRPAPRSGYGLTGLRERVALAGGAVSAGPCPDGGWRLRAILPGEETAESASYDALETENRGRGHRG